MRRHTACDMVLCTSQAWEKGISYALHMLHQQAMFLGKVLGWSMAHRQHPQVIVLGKVLA